jgi:hypothetical protein
VIYQVIRLVCKLLLFFHGCQQGVEEVQDVVYMHGGLNPWAEANDVD